VTGLNHRVMVLAAEGPPGLLPAREQMAVSLGWHIILACFGVAFPTIICDAPARNRPRRSDCPGYCCGSPKPNPGAEADQMAGPRRSSASVCGTGRHIVRAVISLDAAPPPFPVANEI
jgi:hypothetical protein